MMGKKAGDNSQILALAEALAWPFETKHLTYRKTELLTNLFAGPTLMGLIQSQSSALEPPWPELIISAGRRNEPLVRWIQKQAGGPKATKLVHVGRPWAKHECFDLIVTTPQYRLPQKPMILHNEAPLHRVSEERLAAARGAWHSRLEHLPAPRIAVALGGNAGPYNFDTENGALLGHYINQMAELWGGSLMITSSARTPAKAIDAMAAQITAPCELYRWQKNDPDNPYFGYLSMADEIVVTCDSMSMLAEAIATAKPVYIFDLLRGGGSNRPPVPVQSSIAKRGLLDRLGDFRLQPIAYKVGMVTGPQRLTRDVGIIHRRQVEAGRAAWLGPQWLNDGGAKFSPSGGPLPDLQRAANRVRALFS